MSNSRTKFRTLKVTIPKHDNIHTGISLYSDLQKCYKNLDTNEKIISRLTHTISAKDSKIERLNDKILQLNDKIREKNTTLSIERELDNSKFSKMWRISTAKNTASGTRRVKKRKLRKTKRK
tara:strand:+ start:46 stop:411 length:366 start_codon:yes stop_codon:yes gene_type:complete